MKKAYSIETDNFGPEYYRIIDNETNQIVMRCIRGWKEAKRIRDGLERESENGISKQK